MKPDLEMEMYDSLDNITKMSLQVIAENKLMRAALLDAALQFDLYAAHHRAKDPPDTEKVDTNFQWADRCRLATQPIEGDDHDATRDGTVENR